MDSQRVLKIVTNWSHSQARQTWWALLVVAFLGVFGLIIASLEYPNFTISGTWTVVSIALFVLVVPILYRWRVFRDLKDYEKVLLTEPDIREARVDWHRGGNDDTAILDFTLLDDGQTISRYSARIISEHSSSELPLQSTKAQVWSFASSGKPVLASIDDRVVLVDYKIKEKGDNKKLEGVAPGGRKPST